MRALVIAADPRGDFGKPVVVILDVVACVHRTGGVDPFLITGLLFHQLEPVSGGVSVSASGCRSGGEVSV